MTTELSNALTALRAIHREANFPVQVLSEAQPIFANTIERIRILAENAIKALEKDPTMKLVELLGEAVGEAQCSGFIADKGAWLVKAQTALRIFRGA